MSVYQPSMLTWSPAGLAHGVNHTEGLGIGMTLMKLGGRESHCNPDVCLCSHCVICLLPAANSTPAFRFSCLANLPCLSPASLGYCGVSGKGDEVRGGSKPSLVHLCKREMLD